MPQDTIWLNPERTEYAIQAPPTDAIQKDTLHEVITDIAYTDQNKPDHSEWAFPLTVFILVLIWAIIRIRDGKSRGYVELGTGRRFDDEGNAEDENETAEIEEPVLTYYGDELNFTTAELTVVLIKRSVYFTILNPFEKEKFIERLKKFISDKTFKIHDNSGFREMPILISASAIQLSFGLENYQLPDFPFIHIYPDAFVRVDETIRFLEGNVSGNCINISWKYFLEGFEIPDDGQNVGLHEMAHAYYFQNLQCSDCEDRKFKETYSTFEQQGDKVFNEEKEHRKDLYSAYAMTNFQEFWAESVEIFFEKPLKLQSNYPQLYQVMRGLLNQDTARRQL